MTPRSHTQIDDSIASKIAKQKPKRSNSSKKIDKDKEERDKRDQFKARVAWNAASPKGANIMLSSIKESFE